MENCIDVPQKLKIELHDPAILFLGICLKELKTGSWYSHTYAHYSIIHNSQEVETTQMLTSRWIKTIWYTHRMQYYSAFKIEVNPVICYIMDESWGHYAKWNIPVTKRKMIHSIFMSYLLGMESRMGVAKDWGGGRKKARCPIDTEV